MLNPSYENKEQRKPVKCEHCSVPIVDIHKGWNRAGHHWCSKKCYEEDHGYANQARPKRRKV